MSTEVDRAIALLFPANGRRALDVKFFFQPGATVQALAHQIVVCFETMSDPAYAVTDIDA